MSNERQGKDCSGPLGIVGQQLWSLRGMLARLAVVLLGFESTATLKPKSAGLHLTKASHISCGGNDFPVTSGWVHLETGKMFWTLFHAEESAPKDAGLVIQFEGGPGASAFDYPFIGAGPCQLARTEEPVLERAPYPWTAHANLLVVDYPIGAGFSVPHDGAKSANSSALAALDFDDMLQAILVQFPEFQSRRLAISSLSAGGFLVPHVASAILKRNNENAPGRVVKSVDHIILGNPQSDATSLLYWQYEVMCKKDPVLLPSTCDTIRDTLPACLDAMAFLEVRNTLETRRLASTICSKSPEIMYDKILHNRHERKEPRCYPGDTCFWWRPSLMKLMNAAWMRDILGLEYDFKWWPVGIGAVWFAENFDNFQSAYKLLSPVLEAGTQLMVYSGEDDTVCPWQSTQSWMLRMPSQYLDEYRARSFEPFTADRFEGMVANPGRPYTHIRVFNGGHILQQYQGAFTQAVMQAAMTGGNYNPLA